MTKTRIACAVVGVISLVAAALMAWLVTPKWVARVPSGRAIDRTYEGTFQSLLDASAVAGGNLAQAVKTNVPMTVAQHVKVEKTSGNTALVSDSRTTTAAGTAVEQTKWEYAVDRRSLEAVSSHPSDWIVVPAQGLTVSWPFGAEKKTYQGWSPETRTTAPLNYLREEKKQGLTTYVYQAKAPAAKIVDDQILAALPKALPQALLKQLAQGGAVPAAQAAQLGQILPQLSDPVPLTYTFQDDSTFWIDPSTGLVIDVQRTQQRVAAIALPTGTAIPLLPVVAASYRDTEASSKKAADDARDGRTVIRWLGVWVPIILLVLGVVLLALAVLLPGRRGTSRRRRRGGPVVTESGPGIGRGAHMDPGPGVDPRPGMDPGPGVDPGPDPGPGPDEPRGRI
ncbi:MAG: DUF3068 domain-containing protein [Catenulispora sp.]|nr:DUF3068 domain-containing protein [Catenulispora sp.]